MKIKRTVAPDMRTAMKMIREEQGPDAVILGNRRVPGGIEIVSAIDYEAGAVDSKNLFADDPVVPRPRLPAVALEAEIDPEPEPALLPPPREREREPVLVAPQGKWDAHNKEDLSAAERSVRRATELLRAARAAGRGAEQKPARPAARAPVAPAAAPARQPARSAESAYDFGDELPRARAAKAPAATAPAEPSNNSQMQGMQQELQSMRELMAQQLNVMGWGNMTRRQPARVNLLTRLHHLGLGTDLARQLCDGVDSASDPARNWRDALAMLQAQIPESREDIIEHGGVFALVGSTGVGKTSTIAKLAAMCALRHGKQSVALISTDNMRFGAREQLRSFAAILDVPLVFCENTEQLEREVQRLRERKLVLVDTAGLGVNDPRLGQSLAQIRRVKPLQPLLVLPANGQLGALQQTCREFINCDPVGCVVTKVDEAHSMGALVTAVVEHKLPLTWFGSGQRVPEDLTRATAAGLMRLSLGTEALRKPALLDTDELASHFGEAGQYVGA